MSDLSAAVPPVALMQPLHLPAAGASTFQGMDETTKRARIDTASKAYEQSFLSTMLGQMFEGTERTLFGGGAGEEAFTGFLTDAMAKSIEKHGGIGLAKPLAAEMLKLQGLAAKPQVAKTTLPVSTPQAAAPLASPKIVPASLVDIAA